MHPLITYSTERIEIYLADELDHSQERSSMPGEFVETFAAGLDEALTWLDRGEITDVKTMLGLLLSRGRGIALVCWTR